ncbi:MAG: type IV pili twitching motility protein PilT [Candidatus Firestonebacteria bacterium RIFOXYA2_FULL_40_8]|nr:MAG: type IV pili twitching motility protein PilT [Candidatus Firestonebacteria bacterium RIFOXYA2_FULL_40_8]
MASATINDLLRLLFDKNASDLHITAGSPPVLRIDGDIIPTELDKLTPETCQDLIYGVLTDDQKEKFEKENELDLAFGVKGLGRVRMNVFRQRGAVATVLRNIPSRIPTFEELGLPEVVTKTVVKLPKGLVLVTGPTGSGKSTTIASIIDYINGDRKGHIITVEDPIEYVYHHKNCIVNQREIGVDTPNFTSALRHILRQDPDVIVIGEMRDLETIQAALSISETGHLVFGTLHTTDAVQSINRIIDVFPPHQQQQVRTQLSFVLQAVLSQSLLPKAYSGGRVAAIEVMMPNSAIRNLIREDKVHQIYSTMQTSGESGMQTLNQALFNLYQKQMVTYNEIMLASTDTKDLERMAKGI